MHLWEIVLTIKKQCSPDSTPLSQQSAVECPSTSVSPPSTPSNIHIKKAKCKWFIRFVKQIGVTKCPQKYTHAKVLK